METSVSYKYYIVLEQEGGSILYLKSDSYRKEWSGFRKDARSWDFPDPAEEALLVCHQTGDVPPNAKVIKVKTTIEEVAWLGKG